ncbi:MAG: flagellar biosynthetic protein FliO [Maricaulis sp.]|jgi:flagellar protein FliO/FliZ|uniref:flagellar biosynthetic protein FliO n=1 Tax=Maricaulis sp. TaxID=1486257 RepID=UPI001B2D9962|nr:flagellar biosynthetic protein FliO [Maricaulis sp.]MBO6847106.1 flagellar biosynthetic protein FliO [Maricaulis sp.]MBO6876764.1 flagellar biosynthetic protein FliO [Maricaulis sp.]MEC9250427.1 flagellar biosynthetic protein FliO [Pseudomonadota bacterium]
MDMTQYFLALVVLAGLLGAFGLLALAVQRGWIFNQLTGLTRMVATDERRLKVRESLIIDPRRRLVILQADDEEHVVLLGTDSETVLKTQPAKPEPSRTEIR